MSGEFDASSLISFFSLISAKKISSYLADFGCFCVIGGGWVSMNPLLKKENL